MELADITWTEVERLDRRTPVVIPIAALEQHGRHLPLFTDSLLLGEVLRRVKPRFGREILFAPLTWLGNSDHHLDFPGTMSAPARVYLDLLNGMAENFLHHGFTRLVFVNGHGGNDVPARQATFEIRQRHRSRDDLLLLSVTYWGLANAAEFPLDGFAQSEMGHACEWETSMMLRLNPRLVGDYQSAPPVDQSPGFPPAQRAWITKDRTAAGHIGRPDAASPEKGELLFERFSANLCAFLERVVRWDGRAWSG